MNMETSSMEFNYNRYRRLKQKHKQAVKEGKHEFRFDGVVFITDYAKYVLEYLNDRLNNEGK